MEGDRARTGKASSAAGGKGERTRSALVDAAIARFAEHGFRRTSLSDIANDVGLSPAAVYRYFPDKESLYRAAVEADAAEVVDLARQLMVEHLDHTFARLWSRVWPQLVTAIEAHPLIHRVLKGSEPITPDRLMAMGRLNQLRADAVALAEVAQAEGRLRADLDARRIVSGLETISVLQLGYIAALNAHDDEEAQAARRLLGERFDGITAIIDAALRPPVAPDP